MLRCTSRLFASARSSARLSVGVLTKCQRELNKDGWASFEQIYGFNGIVEADYMGLRQVKAGTEVIGDKDFNDVPNHEQGVPFRPLNSGIKEIYQGEVGTNLLSVYTLDRDVVCPAAIAPHAGNHILNSREENATLLIDPELVTKVRDFVPKDEVIAKPENEAASSSVPRM